MEIMLGEHAVIYFVVFYDRDPGGPERPKDAQGWLNLWIPAINEQPREAQVCFRAIVSGCFKAVFEVIFKAIVSSKTSGSSSW